MSGHFEVIQEFGLSVRPTSTVTITGYSLSNSELVLHLSIVSNVSFPIPSADHVRGSKGDDLTILIGNSIVGIDDDNDCCFIRLADGHHVMITKVAA